MSLLRQTRAKSKEEKCTRTYKIILPVHSEELREWCGKGNFQQIHPFLLRYPNFPVLNVKLIKPEKTSPNVIPDANPAISPVIKRTKPERDQSFVVGCPSFFYFISSSTLGENKVCF